MDALPLRGTRIVTIRTDSPRSFRLPSTGGTNGRTPPLFLGTFPPRQCGIATFTQDVLTALDRANGSFSEVVAVDDAPPGVSYAYSGRVVRRLTQQDRSSYAAAARFVDEHPCGALNVQHEFGIFGGDEGDWIFDVLQPLHKPAIVTMHTVLPNPGPLQEAVVRRLGSTAARIVVLSETARDLLIERYGLDPARVRTIPHGVPDVAFEPTDSFKQDLGLGGRFVVSTFGLLGRGKGLETAIEAIARCARRLPEVLYLIVGATHPVVARREGEVYRDGLRARIASLGVERNVVMVDRYLALPELLHYLGASDAYVTPYVNPDQIVSGTLAYAIGAGKPVVSTPYLYARELLADERGIVVPFADPDAMAEALLDLAHSDGERFAMARRAYEFGRTMTWANVGRSYSQLLHDVERTAVHV
jgi:glycosyltransferase involved in cell wall biosynthesis